RFEEVWAAPALQFTTAMGPQPFDLAVAKSVQPTNLMTGTNLSYTIIVSNLGPVLVGGIELTDRLPAMVSYTGGLPPPDSQAGNVLTWILSPIPAQSSATIDVNVAVHSNAVIPLVNEAEVTPPLPDPNLSNNLDTAVTTLSDFDSDGRPDFVDPDDDNDRVSDVDEAIADTDPFDVNSFLQLLIEKTASQTVHNLTFPSSSNRTYFIQGRTNLYSGSWMTAKTNIPGTGGLLTIPQTNTVPLKYFRIGVEE
ncbi:MAG: DUF11 domain-containing protein, partial [Verrucomicrobiota bacterium]